jgi:hypothetical protein
MSDDFNWLKRCVAVLLLATLPMLNTGCASDSYAAQGAAKGAGTGALAGAVGAAATALIFGGDVGEAAARGAVYGGASGAVVGGLSGAEADRRVAEQERLEYERRVEAFRKEIGNDAFNGFVALAECKHDVAIANAREAQRSNKRDYALAGLWVEALTAADRDGAAAAKPLLTDIVGRDREVKDEADAAARLNDGLVRMSEIRKQHDLPLACS